MRGGLLREPSARAILQRFWLLHRSQDTISATHRPYLMAPSKSPNLVSNTSARGPNLREQQVTCPSPSPCQASCKKCRRIGLCVVMLTHFRCRIGRHEKRWPRCASRLCRANSIRYRPRFEIFSCRFTDAWHCPLFQTSAGDPDLVNRSMLAPECLAGYILRWGIPKLGPTYRISCEMCCSEFLSVSSMQE